MIRILSLDPEYDQYGHMVAIKIKVKNDGDKPYRLLFIASVTSKEKGKPSEAKGESTTKERVVIQPKEELEVLMTLNPAILVPGEGEMTIGIGSIIEVQPSAPKETPPTSGG